MKLKENKSKLSFKLSSESESNAQSNVTQLTFINHGNSLVEKEKYL